MADRTWAELIFLKGHVTDIMQAFDLGEPDVRTHLVDSPWWVFRYEEVPEGLQTEAILAASSTRCPFLLRHGGYPGKFSAGAHVSDGVEHCYVSMSEFSPDQVFPVRFDEAGNPERSSVELVQRYLRLRRQFPDWST